jgi:phenylacetaldehyde dehydrogenase
MVNAKSGKTFDVFDPSTGQPIAKAAEGDAADIGICTLPRQCVNMPA